MASYVQDGDIIDHILAEDATAGTVVVIGELVGVVVVDQVAGKPVGVRLDGVWSMTVLGTDQVAKGQKLYWDEGNERLTITAGAHKQAGWAVEGKAAGVTSIRCLFGKG